MSLVSLLRKKTRKEFFTTPSHSGNIFILHKFYQWYRSDISEIDALEPQEELFISQKKAAKIYGTKYTYYLTNGSTSGILASALASVKNNEKLLIWNKSHQSHKHAGIICGAKIIEYELPYNEEWGIYEQLTPSDFENLLVKTNPKAVIVTSPSYEGIVCNVKEYGRICKKLNVILIVDEAHGALYPFSDNLPESAVKYADFTIQSLHKTAGGINPTALLHSNKEDVQPFLDLITTTSPSYPMLATIEANINFLNSKRGKKQIEKLVFLIKKLKSKLTNFEFYGDDITKILLKKSGYTGYTLSKLFFEKYKIEDERTNDKSTMLLTGIGTTEKKLKSLEKLSKI